MLSFDDYTSDSVDGSFKIKFSTEDGHSFETALLPNGRGSFSMCLSSQSGCPMACRFCITGRVGSWKNLSFDELREQFTQARSFAQEHAPDTPVTHVVFMGMGEPLLNLEAVEPMIKWLVDPDGGGLFLRHITVSTSGLLDKIERYSEINPNPGLAISLVSPFEGERRKLMPLPGRHSIAELKETLLRFQQKIRKRLMIEVILFGHSPEPDVLAVACADFAQGLKCFFNLIPYNPSPGLPFTRPDDQYARECYGAFRRQKLGVSIRWSKGSEAAAACGQLAARD